jgi:hypothetical protein
MILVSASMWIAWLSWRLPRGSRRCRSVRPELRLRHDPQTALYIPKQRKNGNTNRESLRSLKHHLVRRVYPTHSATQHHPDHHLLDIGALGFVPAWVVWASIVRPSAPSVIFTLRGFAESATGMRRVSTPVS